MLERGHTVPPKTQWGSFVQLLARANTQTPRATCHCDWTQKRSMKGDGDEDAQDK